jgi:diguanylate cyclase (GGDEF)-like protein
MTAKRKTLIVEIVSPARTRILIAEDEDTIAKMLQAALQLARYEVRIAHDGQEAIEHVIKEPPDIVILDVQMPRLNGLDVCKRIKSDVLLRHIPVLMLTAQGSIRNKVTGLESGADDYVTKPFDMDELLARIRTLLRRTRQGLEANPLTRLPGNVTIEKEIMQRIKDEAPFAVLYIDLNDFKAYNDTYGFVKGDEVIKETARLVMSQTDATGGFIGHIGGDDFVMITTPDKAEGLCQRIIAAFDAKSPEFYSPEDRRQGFITTKNRQGQVTRFPLLSMSIGVVTNQLRKITSLGEVSKIGAEMKHFAKDQKEQKSAYAIDRRKD